MFANGPGDRGSIPGRVILKTQKMVLDSALLKTQHYKVRIKGKGCCSYWKGSLRVTLDDGLQLYLRIKSIWHWITYNDWYALKPNQIKSNNKRNCVYFYIKHFQSSFEVKNFLFNHEEDDKFKKDSNAKYTDESQLFIIFHPRRFLSKINVPSKWIRNQNFKRKNNLLKFKIVFP